MKGAEVNKKKQPNKKTCENGNTEWSTATFENLLHFSDKVFVLCHSPHLTIRPPTITDPNSGVHHALPYMFSWASWPLLAASSSVSRPLLARAETGPSVFRVSKLAIRSPSTRLFTDGGLGAAPLSSSLQSAIASSALPLARPRGCNFSDHAAAAINQKHGAGVKAFEILMTSLNCAS